MTWPTSLEELGFYGGRVSDGGDPNYVGSINQGTRASEDLVKAARKRWHEIPEKDLDRRGDHWIDRASNLLYTESAGSPLLADGPGPTLLFAVIDERIVFLRRPESGAATVEQLDQAEAAQARVEAQAEKVRLAARQKQPRVAVWWGQAAGLGPVSLRDVVRDFEQSGGRVELGPDGQLMLTAPERLSGEGDFAGALEGELRQQLGRQAEAIVHCRVVVEQALAARDGAKTPLFDSIPEGCITLVGGLG